MCEQCEELCNTIPIRYPKEYLHMVQQIREFIDGNLLELLSGSPGLDEVANGAWEDVMHHTFRCTNCKQEFSLTVDTYHGSGGSWEPK